MFDFELYWKSKGLGLSLHHLGAVLPLIAVKMQLQIPTTATTNPSISCLHIINGGS